MCAPRAERELPNLQRAPLRMRCPDAQMTVIPISSRIAIAAVSLPWKNLEMVMFWCMRPVEQPQNPAIPVPVWK